jgi:hypothetical protein
VTRALYERTAFVRGDLSSRLFGPLSRDEYFAGLALLCCLNGLGSRIIDSVRQLGWSDALFVTFEVSAIVWIACILGIRLILREREGSIRPLDLILGVVLLVPVALPIGGLSWLALTILGLYVLLVRGQPSDRRRGAIILLAVTVPMLWSRLLFRYFANFILEVDASLVSLLLGTARQGNMVRFADGSGSLVILPYCSSLANVSLALLAWVTISQWANHRWSSRDWQWCVLAGASVVAVNVTRMSLMGMSETHYRTIHSQWGDAAANVLILCVTMGFCLLGVRRDLLART